MIFTKAEIVCFNSVLDGKNIFGTHFTLRNFKTEDVENTVLSLKKKGLLDDDKKPNHLFYAAAKMLEEYKVSADHLFINKARFSIGNQFLVGLIPFTKNGEEFDLVRMDKAVFYAGILKQSPSLKASDSIVVEKISVPPAEWNEIFKPEDTVLDYYWLQKSHCQKPEKLVICYRLNDELFAYYPAEKELIKCGASLIRGNFMDLLGMNQDNYLKRECSYGK